MRTVRPYKSRCVPRNPTPRRGFSVAQSSQPKLEEPREKETKSEKKHRRPQTILSGIQPTGVPHLGNYLGALRQWKDFQDEQYPDTSPKAPSQLKPFHSLFYSIVDLHALTGDTSRHDRTRLRKESFASLLAIGLSPHYSTLFLQSDIPSHTELMWILSTIASTGYLSRMTQWKSKLSLPDSTTLASDTATQHLKLGLFSYPVLQAADILLYKPTLVPVGDDQAQHIEFARTMARSFNTHFGAKTPDSEPIRNIFDPLPRALISPAKRIMSLRDPAQKMSKSHPDPKSRVLITDSPEEIHAKLRGAVTDSEDGISYDPARRPGVSNLIDILKHVSRAEMSCEEIAREHANSSKQAFKELVGSEIVKALGGFRDRFEEVMKPGNPELAQAYVQGRLKAKSVAGNTMVEVREVLGLKPLDGQWQEEGTGSVGKNEGGKEEEESL